jgi:DNA-binding transcriptional MerR regulator
MRIGEFAAQTGVSVRVLRHYEAQNLIRSERNSNGALFRVRLVERIKIEGATQNLPINRHNRVLRATAPSVQAPSLGVDPAHDPLNKYNQLYRADVAL